MGWSFKWVSASATDFKHDFNVCFTPKDERRSKGQAGLYCHLEENPVHRNLFGTHRQGLSRFVTRHSPGPREARSDRCPRPISFRRVTKDFEPSRGRSQPSGTDPSPSPDRPVLQFALAGPRLRHDVPHPNENVYRRALMPRSNLICSNGWRKI